MLVTNKMTKKQLKTIKNKCLKDYFLNMKCENPLLIYLKNDNIYVKKKLLSMTKKDEKINNLILFN